MANWSFTRMCLAQAENGFYAGEGLWADKKFRAEKAYLDSIQEKAAQGEYGPADAGAWLAPETWETTIWDSLLRAHTIDSLVQHRKVGRSGYQPRVAGDVTVQWFDENTNLASQETSFTFAAEATTAKKMAVFVRVSAEQAADDPDFMDRFLHQELTLAMMTARTSAILQGTGTNGEPTGLLNHGDIPQVQATGSSGALAYIDLHTLRNKVETLNGHEVGQFAGQGEATAVVCHPNTKLSVANFTDTNGNQIWPYDVEAFGGFAFGKWVTTNVLPAQTLSSASTPVTTNVFAGQWDQVRVADTAFSIAATREGSGFINDQLEVRLTMRMDVQVAEPYAFCVMTGVYL